MEHVVCPFVGFYPDLKHPFCVAESHTVALQRLKIDCEKFRIISKGLPECFGFAVRSDDGTIRYADRIEAFKVAKAANQLNELAYPCTYSLESCMLKGCPGELIELNRLSDIINSKFSGFSVNSDI